MNLKTTDINRLIETLGVKSLSGGKWRGQPGERPKGEYAKETPCQRLWNPIVSNN